MRRIAHSSTALAVCSVLLTAGPALAGKAIPTPPERAVVGDPVAVSIAPGAAELAAAERAGGRQIWRTTIDLPDASFVKPHFVEVNLRAGDRLRVIAKSGRVVEEIVGLGPKDQGTFWGLSGFGDRLTLEFEFAHPYARAPFQVDQAIAGRATMLDPAPIGSGTEDICSPAQFENVICYESDIGKWANVFASVGVMSVGGNPNSALFCSGSNVSPTNALLTNNHCIVNQGDCDGSEFVFRFWRTACGGGPTTVDWQSFRCDEVLASSPFVSCDQGLGDLDFTLTSVLGDPAATFGFVQPDPDPLTDGEAIYIVQHPAGRPHEITHGSGSDVDVDGTVLRYYDTLDTEGGSSGSPIFREADDKLVGLHHCGGCTSPGTGNRGMLMSDIYPLIEEFLCSTSIDVAAAGTQELTEAVGDGDGIADPGETWQFRPRVRNQACTGTALGVTGNVAVGTGSPEVTIPSAAVSFGDVPAGAVAPSTAPVAFEIQTDAVCGTDVVLDLTNLIATNGGPFGSEPAILTQPIGETVWTNLMTQDFAGGIPGTWTIDDGGTGSGPAVTWTTANPGLRTLPLTAPFAIADSDELGSGQSMDEQLITPAVDTTGFSVVELQFRHDFRWFSGGQNEQCDVDVRSTATGGAWVNVANFSGGSASGLVNVDLTAHSAPDLQVRFHYHTAVFEWWWAVDEVTIRGGEFSCDVFEPLFVDGFESGDTGAWSATVP